MDRALKLAQHPKRAAWGRPPAGDKRSPILALASRPHLALKCRPLGPTQTLSSQEPGNWGSSPHSWVWEWRESHPEGRLEGSQGAKEGLAGVQPSLAPG